MKIIDLPEQYKLYFLILSNGWECQVNGTTKQNILTSKSTFIELQDGNCINKSFIVQFKLDIRGTVDGFRLLPKADIESISREIIK
jgi:hypothetical protein